MKTVGIEAMNVFGGSACLEVKKLVDYRQLDIERFENLLMKEKTVALPYEDPITFGINAAKPIIDSLTPKEKDRIEMIITCTESAFDFGKSMSTYIHHYLNLNKNCRLFELKNACYSGTAGLQMGINFIISQVSPNAKVLVIATDISRFHPSEGQTVSTEDWSFAEPSNGAGAVAMLISEYPYIFQADVGANGYYGYEIMDTCRPIPDSEAGDVDLSLLSYLNCSENAFLEYQKRTSNVDYIKTFGYLAFHTPFGGMVKGAHRNIMRKIAGAEPQFIETDFNHRVNPGLNYSKRVGNIMGASLGLSLVSTIDKGQYNSPKRIGCFSYGSGCCSEFFSGIVNQESQNRLAHFNIENQLNSRYQLSIEEYEHVLKSNRQIKFGTRNAEIQFDLITKINANHQRSGLLFLKEIQNYHRKYEWTK